MADTIRRRLAGPDLYLDNRLEPASDCARRAVLRRTLRETYASDGSLDDLARLTKIGEPILRTVLRAETFGRAWLRLEDITPGLRRRLVPAADVARQTSLARAIRDALRRREAAERGSGVAEVSAHGR
jgi:ribosome maturation factor RimP